MSHLQNVFPLGHRVYQGGRYLKAFDHAHDIDHYEHSILTFLGSLMPFDKGFVDHPAFPSILTIACSTKISQSTVRKKLRSLEGKGYLKIDAFRFLNERGHFQQSSNNYFLSSLAFEFYESVLVSKADTVAIRKRAVGESFFVPAENSTPSLHEGVHFSSEEGPLAAPVSNSPSELQSESHPDPGSSDGRSRFDMKREVDNLVRMWEELVKVPVSKGEKAKFTREYFRIGGNEIRFMEKLLPIASDPYIAARAQSINFLFSGIDCAIKNREEIVRNASRVLSRVETQSELNRLLSEIPGFIKDKSQNFGTVSDVIVKHLLQDPINSAKSRVGMASDPPVPRHAAELRSAIKGMTQAGVTEQQLRELAIIESAISKLSFGHCLELFSRYHRKHHELEAVQGRRNRGARIGTSVTTKLTKSK